MLKGLKIKYKDGKGKEYNAICKSEEISSDERIEIELDDGTKKRVSIDRTFVCKQKKE